MSRLVITALALLAPALAPPAAAQQADAAGVRAVEVRVVEHDGFRWEDAAVGALAGVGLATLCGGVLVAFGRKRRSIT